MVININGVDKSFDNPIRVIDTFDNSDRKVVACLVNNRLKDLNYLLKEDSKIEFITLNDSDGSRVFSATLRYVVSMAVKRVFPDARCVFSNALSRSLYMSILNVGNLDLKDLKKLILEINNIVNCDYDINFEEVSMEVALNRYKEENYNDKIEFLKYRNKELVHMYSCEGYYDYMHTYLMPKTGYLKNFKIKAFGNGLFLSYPRSELGGKLPKQGQERAFKKTLLEASKWSVEQKADSLVELHKKTENGDILDFINLCETRHNRQLTYLGDEIEKNISNIKLICVAGPSSSGKTTFTNRLRIDLKSRGHEPFMISMDNFYKCDNYPLNKDGSNDYEHIKALDLKLFDKVIYSLVQGEEVRLPIFHFGDRYRTFTEPVKLKPNQPIMIEGIHGLNDLIAPSIMPENKFRIYISPIGYTRIDDHTPVSITDLRLLRRIVRDAATRKTSCEHTITQWPSVRAGEFKWIFPNQDNADFVFNSELTYEICVIAKHAKKLLESVPRDSKNYNTARRLLKIVKHQVEIDDKWVPCNSILREFIGGSIFYPDDQR